MNQIIQVKQAASVFKALGDENRIRILLLLGGGELCACKLLEYLQISQSTLSHHMKILCDAGIVTGRKEGRWITGGFWFGFDITHSGMVGTERLLMAMLEEPEWCADMFNHELDLDIALMDRVWAEGYHFDELHWYDDMGYKNTQFFSLKLYRELLKPAHQRAIDWGHSHGIPVRLHSCGDIRPLVPELVSMGLDGLNPLEVKAGMDPVALKHSYGDKLLFHGGVNAVLWDQPEKIAAEIERVVPEMKKNGGYIFASDHSIPPHVSFKDFCHIIECVKRCGRYD